MPHPHKKHPYSGRPNHRYVTVVLEEVDDTDRAKQTEQRHELYNSLQHGTELTILPGYRVTGISTGDELSEQEYAEEQAND